MRRAREVGETRAYSKGGQNYYQLGPEVFEELKLEWKRGAAFWEGPGFFGEPTCIKFGDIAVIELATAEMMAADRAARAADKAEDMLESAG